MSYVACENAIQKWSRFVIKNAQKTRYIAFTFTSGLKFGTLLQTRVAQFTSILPVFAKVAFFRNIVAFSMF